MRSDRIKSIIEQEGQQVTYKSLTGVTRNATTLQKANTYTSYTIYAHIQNFFARPVAGLIQEGDRICRIAAASLPITPKKNDLITVDGEDFSVTSVDIRKNQAEEMLFIVRISGNTN